VGIGFDRIPEYTQKPEKPKQKVNPWNSIPLKSFVVVQHVKSVGLESQAGEMETAELQQILDGAQAGGQVLFYYSDHKTPNKFHERELSPPL